MSFSFFSSGYRKNASPHFSKSEIKLLVENLQAGYGGASVLENVNLRIKKSSLTAIMGDSGVGKSTFLSCINRMHEHRVGANLQGKIFLDGQDVYAKEMNPVLLRRRVALLSQKPNPFPHLSLKGNVLCGLRFRGGYSKKNATQSVENTLRQVGLWDEVKDRLTQSAMMLSVGQQQRLCLARVLFTSPEVILLDEPCSGLDANNSERINQLLLELKREFTIVLVTHDLKQAKSVADQIVNLNSLKSSGKSACRS